MDGAQGIVKIIWFNQDSYGHFLLLFLFNSMDTQVDVELLDKNFQQANFMAIAQVMAQPAHTSLWCVMHDCAFTHAYSIVMVEYIINLF